MAEFISILVPVYNCERWIGRAIETALNQTWADKEIIVLDDCSSDKSHEILHGWRGQIRVIRSQQNQGQNVSRNKLTNISKGSWLLFLDADDELSLDAVERKMAHAAIADAIYGTANIDEYNGDQIASSTRLEPIPYSEPVSTGLLWRFPNTSAFMFRRSALVEVGGWNENIHNCTDYDLYFRLILANKKIHAAPNSITVYRQWSANQAVYENSYRLVMTRLELLWRFALELERLGRLTAENRNIFCNTTLSVIRTLYQIDPGRAFDEHRRLKMWNPGLAPTNEQFSKGYCLGYHLFGFGGAEGFARATRFLRPRPKKANFMPLETAK